MADEIIELLNHKKLRAEVIETIKEVYSYAGTLNDNPTEDMEEAVETLGTSLWEEAWWRAETCGKIHKIEDAFEKYVYNKLKKPYRIYPEEISESFFKLARPGGFGSRDLGFIDFNNLYTIFINYITLQVISDQQPVPFPICIIPSNDKEFFKGLAAGYEAAINKQKNIELDLDKQEEEEEELLLQQNGVNIRLSGRASHGINIVLSAIVSGRMSPMASQQLSAETSLILKTVIKSMSLLWPMDNQLFKDCFIPDYLRNKNLPFIEEELLQSKKMLIQKCLAAYYSASTRKDSIDKRIRNAVSLLIQSDAQSNDAVGLALSVTAIEALLGEKSADISERLSTNVVVLLEPDRSKRSDAVDFVKDLYNLRSATLHGEEIKPERDFRTKARHLAAGALISMIEYQNFLDGAGYEPQPPRDLIKYFRKTRFDPGLPMGVSETNVRKLWGNK